MKVLSVPHCRWFMRVCATLPEALRSYRTPFSAPIDEVSLSLCNNAVYVAKADTKHVVSGLLSDTQFCDSDTNYTKKEQIVRGNGSRHPCEALNVRYVDDARPSRLCGEC